MDQGIIAATEYDHKFLAKNTYVLAKKEVLPGTMIFREVLQVALKQTASITGSRSEGDIKCPAHASPEVGLNQGTSVQMSEVDQIHQVGLPADTLPF